MSAWHSDVVRGQIIFGRHPSATDLNHLRQQGVSVVVDLTVSQSYQVHDMIKVSFPIVDGAVPTDTTAFNSLLIDLSTLLDQEHKIYVHCRHGRGRSGLVTAALLRYHFGLSLRQALAEVNQAYWQGHGQYQTKMIPHLNQLIFLIQL